MIQRLRGHGLALVLSAAAGTLPAQETFIPIDVPGASRTQARYLNPRGDIVVFYTAGGVVHGFLQSKSGEQSTIDFPGATFTMAVGINAQGDVVGIYGAAGRQHGFLRTRDGAFFSVDVPNAANTNA